MKIQQGDIVRFLSSVGGGTVTRVDGNVAYVEDEDGFETPALLRECVVVGHASDQPNDPYLSSSTPAVKAKAQPTQSAASKETPSAVTLPENISETEPEEFETEHGDVINVVLGYQPVDIKQLSQQYFETYLVNDSNYYLYFTYSTRAAENHDGWQVRYAGIVEPNIQIFIGEVRRENLTQMDRLAVQMIAFKRNKEFALLPPMDIVTTLDVTKFAKLHCFKDNIYFDTPVISLPLVTDGIPLGQNKSPQIHSKQEDSTEQAIEKLAQKFKPAEKTKSKTRTRRIPRRYPVEEQRQPDGSIVIDLHIEALLDDITGMGAADILNYQVDEFSHVMDRHLQHKGQKLIFIHGKGDGVLRKALIKELSHRYKGHDVSDASFEEYGYGATQVVI